MSAMYVFINIHTLLVIGLLYKLTNCMFLLSCWFMTWWCQILLGFLELASLNFFKIHSSCYYCCVLHHCCIYKWSKYENFSYNLASWTHLMKLWVQECSPGAWRWRLWSCHRTFTSRRRAEQGQGCWLVSYWCYQLFLYGHHKGSTL